MNDKRFEMRTKPTAGKMTGSGSDWAAPVGTPIPKSGGVVVIAGPRKVVNTHDTKNERLY